MAEIDQTNAFFQIEPDSDQPFISKIDGVSWGFAYVKSRTERKLADRLTSLGVTCYLPLLNKLRIHHRGKVLSTLPMFPGYLFVSSDSSQIIEVRRQREIVTLNIMEGAAEEAFIHELNTVRKCEILSNRRKVVVNPGLVPGKTALIRHGALQGTEVVVVRRLNEVSLIVNLHILGRSCDCRIAADELKELV